jgi:hypothetical protein
MILARLALDGMLSGLKTKNHALRQVSKLPGSRHRHQGEEQQLLVFSHGSKRE